MPQLYIKTALAQVSSVHRGLAQHIATIEVVSSMHDDCSVASVEDRICRFHRLEGKKYVLLGGSWPGPLCSPAKGEYSVVKQEPQDHRTKYY